MTPQEELQYLRGLDATELKAATLPPPGILESAGKGLVYEVGSLGRGIEQINPALPERRKQTLAQEQQAANEAIAPYTEQRPFATAMGGSAPYLATGPLSPIQAAMVTGLVEASKYGSENERLLRGARGAAGSLAGSLLGAGAGRLLAPVSRRAGNEAFRESLRAANRLGVLPRLSTITGSKLAETLEGLAANIPGGAGVMRDFVQANQTAINRGGARAIGQNADDLSAPVLAKASDDLGMIFDEIKSLHGKPIKIGNRVADAADEVIQQQSQLQQSLRDNAVISLANDARRLAGLKSAISGNAYQANRAKLSDRMATAFASGESQAGHAYKKLLSALDDTAEESLRNAGHEQLARDLRAVRPLWANLKILEKGSVVEGGNLNAKKLANALAAANPKKYKEGRMGANPLADVASIGNEFQSFGTLPGNLYGRAIGESAIGSTLAALPAYLLAKAITSSKASAVPRMLATNAAGRIAGQALPKTLEIGGRALAPGLLPELLPLILAPNGGGS